MCHGNWFMEVLQHIVLPFAALAGILWAPVKSIFVAWKNRP